MPIPQPNINFDGLGIQPAADVVYTPIRERETHVVYRVTAGERRFILKTFLSQEAAKEIRVYALLKSLCVPTLPVYAQGPSYLLLEDLEASQTWRLAAPEDMRRAWVGRAVAEWYRQFHDAGSKYIQQGSTLPGFLRSWVDALTVGALAEAGEKLAIGQQKSWQEAIKALETLKKKYHTFPQTLNYFDFAGENLALTRERVRPIRAIVFDYDILSTGIAYSDIHNVVSSLEGAARDTFLDIYGPVDPREKAIDQALSTIEGIVTASKLARLPAWAEPLIDEVQNGTFERDLKATLV